MGLKINRLDNINATVLFNKNREVGYFTEEVMWTRFKHSAASNAILASYIASLEK